MFCRLYSNECKCWIDDFYINPLGEVVIPKKSLFGTRLAIASDLEYTYHMNTGLWDKNGKDIYEGDICKLDIGDGIVGVVAYAERTASYYVFDDLEARYYPLSQKSCEMRVEVIGNVFDGILKDKMAKT